VLDPGRTRPSIDHYLEVDLDLSEVMFVCTANSLNIPGPLLDRMEVIRLRGYNRRREMNIGRRNLVRTMKNTAEAGRGSKSPTRR